MAAIAAGIAVALTVFLYDRPSTPVARANGPVGTIETMAGGGAGDGLPPTQAAIAPVSYAFDAAGDMYISDSQCRVRKISGGIVTTVAGTGGCGYNGDGVATKAQLNQPRGLAFNGAGELFIGDANNCLVRKLSSETLTSVIGTPGRCWSESLGDGGPAANAILQPSGLAFDAGGKLYIADVQNCRIRLVSAGVITTVAGTGVCGIGPDSGTATTVQLDYPFGVTVGPEDALYIADTGSCHLRRVVGGSLTTLVTNSPACGGVTRPSTAGEFFSSFSGFTDVAVDASGNVFFAEECRIKEISGASVTILTGNSVGCGLPTSFPAPAATTSTFGVQGITVRGSTLYFSEYCMINSLAGGTIDLVAGSPRCGTAVGDGGAATNAPLFIPLKVRAGPSGDLYILERCRVRKVHTGVISTVAGSHCADGHPYTGDGGPALNAELYIGEGMDVDASGNIFITDKIYCAVRRIDGSSGTITTVVGEGVFSGTCGDAPDGVSAVGPSRMIEPTGIHVDSNGDLYIADTGNCKIRKVHNGILTTFAGFHAHPLDPCPFGGDGGAATAANLQTPVEVTTDPAGDLYIAEACRIRKVHAGIISTVVGGGGCGFNGDGLPATSTSLYGPEDVTFDAAGNMYIADTQSCRVRVVTRGTVYTVTGFDPVIQVPVFSCGYHGDGGPVSGGQLNYPYGLAVAGDDLYVDDALNARIRRINGLDGDGDSWPLGADNCPTIANPDQADNDAGASWRWIKDGAPVPEGRTIGGDACDMDNDNDGCPDSAELGPDWHKGGQRDPLSPWDFFDIPVPALLPSDATGLRNKAITIADVIAILQYIGTSESSPHTPNANGATYGSDLNANGVPDGREYDRTPSSNSAQPWRSGPPNGAVTIQDALVELGQVGTDCTS